MQKSSMRFHEFYIHLVLIGLLLSSLAFSALASSGLGIMTALKAKDSKRAEDLLRSLPPGAEESLVEDVDAEGKSALHVAIAEEASAKVLALLLERMAGVDGVDWQGRTPLLYAAKQANRDLMGKLLKRGADVNHRDEEGWSALTLALVSAKFLQKSVQEQFAIFKLCLEAGADAAAEIPVDEQGQKNLSLLAWTLDGHQEPLSARLRKRGLHLRADDSAWLLMRAIERGQLDEVQSLVEQAAEQGVDLSSPLRFKGRSLTALALAVEKERLAIVEFLLPKTDLSSLGGERQAMLSWAARKRHFGIIAALDAAQALSSQDLDLLLGLVLEQDQLGLLKWLVERGLILSSPPYDHPCGDRLLALAVEKDSKPVAKWVGMYCRVRSSQQFTELLSLKSQWVMTLGPEQSNGFEPDFLALVQKLKELIDTKTRQLYYQEREGDIHRENWSPAQPGQDESPERACIVCHEPGAEDESESEDLGPADCPCFVCEECRRHLCEYTLERDGEVLSQCCGCKQPVQSDFLARQGISAAEVEKFRIRQVDHFNSQQAGWMACKTPGCSGGRVVPLNATQAYLSCFLCDCSGCLRCGKDHMGDCRDYEQRQKDMQELLRFGAMAPPRSDGHSSYDPRQGRYRPCYHCGVITERIEGCNQMTCKACKKIWHWNIGNSSINGDFTPGVQQYTPLKEPHF